MVSREKFEQAVREVKDWVRECEVAGVIRSVGLKGGASIQPENAKKAGLMIESWEKQMQRGEAFKYLSDKQFNEMIDNLRNAAEAKMKGDNKKAMEYLNKATPITI
jgi:hypothetical protein